MDEKLINDLLTETKAGRLNWEQSDGEVEGKNPFGYRCRHGNQVVILTARETDDKKNLAFDFTLGGQKEAVELRDAAHASINDLYNEANVSANREPKED